jgi:hypothetical protein
MTNNDSRKADASTSRQGAFTADLRGRQSVRATFKLSRHCIDAISIVATQLGIKQKSIFDQLVEDTRFLSRIADQLEEAVLNRSDRRQKTFVVSRKSLLQLEKIANETNTPRDALVETAVQRLMPIITAERRKHERRKKVFDEVTSHVAQGKALLEKMYAELGGDDPLFDRFAAGMSVMERNHAVMADYIERGKMLEAFPFEEKD